MEFYRPTRSQGINQYFGENGTCVGVGADGKTRRPIKVISKKGGVCPVGYKDFYKQHGLKGHNGYDQKAWHGEPVYFSGTYDGWVKYERDLDGGIGVDVVSNEPLLKCREVRCGQTHYIKQRLWHGLKPVGTERRQVKPGELVMLADSTGASSGDHVHWAPKWCDKNGAGLHNDNGYVGAFRFDDLYSDEFILDALKKKPAPVSELVVPAPDIPVIAAKIEEAQLTLIQIIYKYIFLLREKMKNL